MGHGGGNSKRKSYVGRRNTTQGSNSSVLEHEHVSSHMDVRTDDSSPNTPSNTDDYTSESSQRLALGSNTTPKIGPDTIQHMFAGSLHKTYLLPLRNVFNVQGAPSIIREILMETFDGNWPTWSKVPKTNQDLMFERFQVSSRYLSVFRKKTTFLE